LSSIFTFILSEPGAPRLFHVTSTHSFRTSFSLYPPQISVMKTISIIVATLVTLASTAVAVPPFDPAGAPNVGNGQGGQFITGQCLSDADCGSGCCAFPTGICSGVGAAFQQGKQGCGFGSGAAPQAPAGAAPAPPAADPAQPGAFNGGPPFDPSGDKNVGNGSGQQFIGGQCLNNADCASGCCAGPSGICSGVGASTQNGKTGCGFVTKRSLHLPGRRSHVVGDLE
jgi:hypothetical protein